MIFGSGCEFKLIDNCIFEKSWNESIIGVFALVVSLTKIINYFVSMESSSFLSMKRKFGDLTTQNFKSYGMY